MNNFIEIEGKIFNKNNIFQVHKNLVQIIEEDGEYYVQGSINVIIQANGELITEQLVKEYPFDFVCDFQENWFPQNAKCKSLSDTDFNKEPPCDGCIFLEDAKKKAKGISRRLMVIMIDQLYQNIKQAMGTDEFEEPLANFGDVKLLSDNKYHIVKGGYDMECFEKQGYTHSDKKFNI